MASNRILEYLLHIKINHVILNFSSGYCKGLAFCVAFGTTPSHKLIKISMVLLTMNSKTLRTISC